MEQGLDRQIFFCEQTLSWFLGFFACCGFFYSAAIAGASEFHPIALASGFGSIYFFVKIITHGKLCLTSRYPILKRKPRSPQVHINESKISGPLVFTMLFGPVLAWLFLVVIEPSTDEGKLASIVAGLILFFVVSFIWLNKKTEKGGQ